MPLRTPQIRMLAFAIAAAGATLAACSDREDLTGAAVPSDGLRRIVVTPKTASVEASRSVRFNAYGLNTSNDSVAVPVSWSASGGVITRDGNFTADTTNGVYQVIASGADSRADTATITVSPHADPPPALSSAECATPGRGWIWCDDFEQNRLSRYFEYNDAGGRFTRVSGTGVGSSTAMRARWNRGDKDAGFLHLAMGRTPQAQFRPVDDGSTVYREIYWRLYLKRQAGWVGGGADKLTRAITLASSTSYAEAAFAHLWSGNSGDATTHNYLLIEPASGTDEAGQLRTTGYNDFPHMRWLGSAMSKTPIFDAAHAGQWQCIEAHVRLNTPGRADGMFELWINGQPEAQRTGLNFVGRAAYGINAVYFENYWNGVGNSGAVAGQERYLDNIVVSTARIGCL